MRIQEKLLWAVGSLSGLLLICAIIFRLGFVNFVDNYEFGYMYDARNGQLTSIKRTGYIVSWPFVQAVHTIDLRPMQVGINSNSRVLNCKLVQFDTTGWRLFVSWHGRNNYQNDGMAMTNGSSSTNSSSNNLNSILMCYAYDGTGKKYPFLKIITEMKNDVVDTSLIHKSTKVITPRDTIK